MICVTGAGGTVGSEVVEQLRSADAPFRAAYFSASKAEAARAKGIDAVIIDYNRPETIRSAFQNCDKLFLLGPNVLNQAQLEQDAVEAAKAVGIKHIVKLSAFGAGEEGYAVGRLHRQVEKVIESSGLVWTFIRPNSFMQNVVTFMGETIKSEGVFYNSSGNGKISHVDVRDVAAVVVKALTEPGHQKRTYELSGPEALTYEDIAMELSNVLGPSIKHVNLSPSDLKSGMLSAGTPEWFADLMLDLERHCREQRASRVTNDVREVTGRDPIRFERYARDYAGVLQRASAV
jgi:uncharacterized protein YbjT (DUF2867 family)